MTDAKMTDLKTECEALADELIDDVLDCDTQTCEFCRAPIAKAAEYLRAMPKYVQHLPGCPRWDECSLKYGESECTCDLDDLLQGEK